MEMKRLVEMTEMKRLVEMTEMMKMVETKYLDLDMGMVKSLFSSQRKKRAKNQFSSQALVAERSLS